MQPPILIFIGIVRIAVRQQRRAHHRASHAPHDGNITSDLPRGCTFDKVICHLFEFGVAQTGQPGQHSRRPRESL